MIRWLFRLIFKLSGWRLDRENLPDNLNRCVLIAAPHTSNWDFVYARACFDFLDIPVRYTVKKELNRFPIGSLLEDMGAIWIDRSPKEKGEARPSMVNIMSDLFNEHEELAIMVTPEGTRSLREKWKSGFYHVAQNADVPIGLGYLDYKNKIAGVGKLIYPSGNKKDDMETIMDFYRNIEGKYPKQFSIDKRYT